MLIEQPPRWFRMMFPGAIFRMRPEKEKEKSVYLTFDDGPIPEVTPLILDILERYDVKSTFFMVGENVKKYPFLLEDIKERGHGIGNHTYHHLKGLTVSAQRYLEDAKECETLTCSRLFRPPHGLMTPEQLRLIKKHYDIIMYDLVTRDYSRRLSMEEVVKNVKRYSRDGSIIVFHDSLKSRSKIMDALPRSIEWLKENGYGFKVIPQNIKSL